MEQRHCKRDKLSISLDVTDDFASSLQANQKNWVLVRALEELSDDLEHYDLISNKFVKGSTRPPIKCKWVNSKAEYDSSQLNIEGQQVMQDWERPYMEAMSKSVTEDHHGDVLEVGFGMGISATYIQEFGVKSHTIIECNEDVQLEFDKWKTNYQDKDIKLVFGKWQDVIDQLGLFDGIFFDTYPLSEEEFNKYVIEDVTFGQHFFESAANHLKKGGVFTYYSNEIDSVGRRHQRKLFELFETITFSIVHPLYPPADCNYWWADSMIVVKAIK